MKERKQKLKNKASVVAHFMLALGSQKQADVCELEPSLLYIEFQDRENHKERPCLQISKLINNYSKNGRKAV